jgi:hypothetical protein
MVRQTHKNTIAIPSKNHILNRNFFPKPAPTLAMNVPRGTFRFTAVCTPAAAPVCLSGD